MRRVIAALAVAISVPVGAASPYYSADEVLHGLRLERLLYTGEGTEANRELAAGIREYVMDAAEALGNGRDYCPPGDWTRAEMTGVVRDYLALHPERGQMSGAVVTQQALMGYWPCRGAH